LLIGYGYTPLFVEGDDPLACCGDVATMEALPRRRCCASAPPI